jgi:XTP/dITP diphosphohydrolase
VNGRGDLATLLVATRSKGKVRELIPLLNSRGFRPVTLDDVGIPSSSAEDHIETAATFEENAIAKARYFHAKSGMPTVADDSGLEVAALGGAPGVFSKRWSGSVAADGSELEANNRRKLLRELGNENNRAARFVCVAAFVDGERELIARGVTTGRILFEERGAGGFGYDPLFLSDDLGRTMAECDLEEKERVSHRGRAMHALLNLVQDVTRRVC